MQSWLSVQIRSVKIGSCSILPASKEVDNQHRECRRDGVGVQTSTAEGSGGSTDLFVPLLKHSVHVSADWESSTNQAWRTRGWLVF